MKQLFNKNEYNKMDPRERRIADLIEGAYCSGLFEKISECQKNNDCSKCPYAFRMAFTGGNSIWCSKFDWHFGIDCDVSALPLEPPCGWTSTFDRKWHCVNCPYYEKGLCNKDRMPRREL